MNILNMTITSGYSTASASRAMGLVALAIVLFIVCLILYFRHRKKVDIQRKITFQNNIMNIDNYFNEEINKANKDYPKLVNFLTQRYVGYSDYINVWINKILAMQYATAINMFFNGIYGINRCLLQIEILKGITEIDNRIQHTLKYRPQFYFENVNYKNSVFYYNQLIDNAIKQIKLRAEYYEKLYIDILTMINEAKRIKDTQALTAVDIITFANTSNEYIYEMLNALVYFAIKDNYNSEKYENLFNIVKMYYYVDVSEILNLKPNDDYLVEIPINMIISQVLNYNRGGLISKTEPLLKKYLAHSNLNTDICDILINLFQYLKAKKQEEIVLEYMFERNLPRTAQHEARLAFLKKGINNAPDVINIESSEQNKMLYDYRSVKWDSKQVKDYFEMLTMNGEKLYVPLVFDEWKQSVPAQGFVWSDETAFEVINAAICNEFDNHFSCYTVLSRTVNDLRSEGISTIIITSNNHPEILISVIGEQFAKSNVDLAIYGIFCPDKVQGVSDKDVSNYNSILCNQFISIKEGENPKISAMIATVKSVITRELEVWFNGTDTIDF